jgi:NADH-quinone oxidoreductase subunit L
MSNLSYILLIPLIPLAAFLILGLFGRTYFNKQSGWIGTLFLLVSTLLSFITAYQYFFVKGTTNGVYDTIKAFNYTWLEFSPSVSIDMGLLIDPISVMMIVVVCFVSLMVHIFSMGYMKGEERLATYYSFLALFTFSMLGLVLSSNIFQIYMFWELVGVSSYLLIGFYYQKPAAVAASKKAFIVTRFADLGFLVGILILGFHSGTLDFGILTERLTNSQSPEFINITTASFLGISVLTWGLVLVFMGGAGKSAMFPLHIWLPDAMEGPTPVSALIHAATMVVAGVYLVARLFPLYAIDAAALEIVTWVGASSALIAAVIACTQTDIKRVLAYSTMSQIGYMMFALGISGYGGEAGLGYTASLFHLFTHAFFKSLLFLCAGAIIHFVHTNDMREMGGLRKLMPLTHICFLIACLAIAGIPPFAGFFSKEEILLAAYQSNQAIYFLALFTAVLTSFYMFRLYFSIFWNRTSLHQAHSEGTVTMKLPLLLLAICTAAAGFIPFGSYISSDKTPLSAHFDPAFAIPPVLLSIVAIAAATWLYKKENNKPASLANSLGGLYTVVSRKFYTDENYLFITKKLLFNLVGRPAAWIDKNIVDGLVNRSASVTAATAESIKGLQSGRVQTYAIYFFGGVIALAALFIYYWR